MAKRRDETSEIELIDELGVAPAVAERKETIRSQRPRWVEALVVVAMFSAGLWWLSSSRSATPAEPAAPTSTAPSSSTDDRDLAEVGPSLAPGLEQLGDQRILVVVSDRSGTESQLISMTAGAADVTELPPLNNFVFDASGRWLAGTSLSRLTEVQEILWVAPVGGVFEPVAIDVRGFAWHDEDPGRIAWTTEERTSVRSLDFEGPTNFAEQEVLELPIAGALRGWGSWGYAMVTSFRVRASAVVDPQGELLLEEVPGVYAGRWHDGRLLFSGGSSSSIFMDVATWSTEVVPFLDEDDYVWTLAASEDETVVLVGERGVRSAPFDGSVVRSVNGITGSTAAAASAYTRLAWLEDAVVFADQEVLAEAGASDRAGLTILTSDDRRIELLLPDVFDERVWIAAIAVSAEFGVQRR